jgi:hypothetical protein
MTWGIRSSLLVAGATALLSSQAVYAAPVRSQQAVDPLVSLSVLGTDQSRAAVCGAARAASCGLPVSVAASAATTAAMAQGDSNRRGVNPLLLLLGLVIIIGVGVALISGGGDGNGDLSPVSP